MTCVLRGHEGKFYIYNNGTLRRKDNTIQFINENNEKRNIPLNG